MPHLTMCMIHPQSVEEANHVRNLYRAQLARVTDAIGQIEIYYNDHIREIEKYGERAASRDSYLFKVQELLLFYHDLNYQEAYHISRKDGSINYFYRAAYIALLSGEIVCELERNIKALDNIAKGLSKGRVRAIRKKKSNKEAKEIEISAALQKIYDGGARYPTLDAWSNKVIEMLPHLSPPRGKPNATLNEKVSEIGHQTLGSNWPVRPRGRSRSSQSETSYSGTD